MSFDRALLLLVLRRVFTKKTQSVYQVALLGDSDEQICTKPVLAPAPSFLGKVERRGLGDDHVGSGRLGPLWPRAAKGVSGNGGGRVIQRRCLGDQRESVSV